MSTRIIDTSSESEHMCTNRERNGKCVIMLPAAIFCLDCHCISTSTICPNCLSGNSVRLVEIAFNEGDVSHDVLKARVQQRLRV